jgi:peptidoglycan/xylan/chitin deacetylase (PgdA/CDA1 family)
MRFLNSIKTLLLCSASILLAGQSLAITLDDAPNLDATPRLSGAERNQRLLDAFGERKVRVVLFTNGIRGGDSREGARWLAAWGKAGHRIGNHTYHHQNLQEVGLVRFREDLLHLDAQIRTVPGYWPMLRFPFLAEGKGPVERKAAQAMLAEVGYLPAPVSLPTYDWLFNARLHKLLEARPEADLTPLKALYLQHLADILKGYRELGLKLLGRDPVHSVLLHHNLLNALVMPDLLRMLEVNGWKIVSPEEAYRDPLYREDITSVGYSESHLGALARREGLFLEDVRQLEAKFALEIEHLKEYVP